MVESAAVTSSAVPGLPEESEVHQPMLVPDTSMNGSGIMEEEDQVITTSIPDILCDFFPANHPNSHQQNHPILPLANIIPAVTSTSCCSQDLFSVLEYLESQAQEACSKLMDDRNVPYAETHNVSPLLQHQSEDTATIAPPVIHQNTVAEAFDLSCIVRSVGTEKTETEKPSPNGNRAPCGMGKPLKASDLKGKMINLADFSESDTDTSTPTHHGHSQKRLKSCLSSSSIADVDAEGDGSGNGSGQRMTHITVERNRRKQMNEHLAVLRSLMPGFYVQRGDQASIIGGVIEFIKELQQLLQTLESQKQRKAYAVEALSPRPSSSPRPALSPRTPPQLSSATPFRPSSLHLSSSTSSSGVESVNELVANSKSAVADVEVKIAGSNALLKTLSHKIPGQTLKIVSALENMSLEILHLNISTIDDTVLNSFTLKIGIECKLSVEELAQAVQQTFSSC